MAREIDQYKKGGAKQPVPYDVLHWLGQGYFEAAVAAQKPDARSENFGSACKYLAMLTARDDARPDDFLNLGRSHLGLAEFEQASTALLKYLAKSSEPGPRCVGLLALGQAQIGLKSLDAAQKSAESALALQPEGELNVKARMLSGDILIARGDFEAAAAVYESAGVVIDDETITPLALEKAIGAYKQAGKDADAKRLQNTLQSRYPEYFQGKPKAVN